MNCPGCAAPMRDIVVDGVQGETIDVSSCATCGAFWFGPYQELHLTRRATLQLIRVMTADGKSRRPFPARSRCPVCGAQLRQTRDRQRTSGFAYWRCQSGHGRFTPFIDFLREKDFVKPLSAAELERLRQDVRVINCPNCGGAIDLATETACGHCAAPLSILDAEKLRQLASDLEHTTLPKPKKSRPALSPQVIVPPRESDEPSNLIERGLQAFAEWLQGKSEV